ncbi:hypothetical protein KIPB_015219 [Kipferlia bialata]|uniref:Secreted protein n=1 Tax=Kipferlia bialata TaxID=797122 RepID=A0A391P0T1_9EUKA|nr:hypothetical protein KIPB_015219 [Kipferlia bialata]|eukprot:g15219.t1
MLASTVPLLNWQLPLWIVLQEVSALAGPLSPLPLTALVPHVPPVTTAQLVAPLSRSVPLEPTTPTLEAPAVTPAVTVMLALTAQARDSLLCQEIVSRDTHALPGLL